MDRGKTGEERPKGEVDVHGIDATCLVPASRIKYLPVIIWSCDDPAKLGDLIFGDLTVLESENKNKDPFPSIAFQDLDGYHRRSLLQPNQV